MTEKRKFTKEEKLQLIKEAGEKGVKITFEKVMDINRIGN